MATTFINALPPSYAIYTPKRRRSITDAVDETNHKRTAVDNVLEDMTDNHEATRASTAPQDLRNEIRQELAVVDAGQNGKQVKVKNMTENLTAPLAQPSRSTQEVENWKLKMLAKKAKKAKIANDLKQNVGHVNKVEASIGREDGHVNQELELVDDMQNTSNKSVTRKHKTLPHGPKPKKTPQRREKRDAAIARKEQEDLAGKVSHLMLGPEEFAKEASSGSFRHRPVRQQRMEERVMARQAKEREGTLPWTREQDAKAKEIEDAILLKRQQDDMKMIREAYLREQAEEEQMASATQALRLSSAGFEPSRYTSGALVRKVGSLGTKEIPIDLTSHGEFDARPPTDPVRYWSPNRMLSHQPGTNLVISYHSHGKADATSASNNNLLYVKPVLNPVAQAYQPGAALPSVSIPYVPPMIARQPQSYRPEPTAAYFERAHQLAHRLQTPQPLLIILDLNGTLLLRVKRSTSFSSRPGLDNFLNYLFTTTRTPSSPYPYADPSAIRPMIWTSAQPETCQQITLRLLTDSQRSACVAIWARDRLGLSRADYHGKVQVYKQLETVWADPLIQLTHPGFGQGARWDQRNTLLIDDSLEKARAQPFNLVNLPEFTKEARSKELAVRGGESVLDQVRGWVEEARWWSDVSAFARMRPFKIGDGRERRAVGTGASVQVSDSTDAAASRVSAITQMETGKAQAEKQQRDATRRSPSRAGVGRDPAPTWAQKQEMMRLAQRQREEEEEEEKRRRVPLRRVPMGYERPE